MTPMPMVRVHSIVNDSYVDGPGRRTTIFMQGCPLACRGCQNRHLWPNEGGQLYKAKTLASEVYNQAKASQGRPDPNITISGGEPFAQAEALAAVVCELRNLGTGHVIIYSGYTWEELQEMPFAAETLVWTNVLVDGRYNVHQDTSWMQYRGSANQRPIDVPATIQQGELVLLDWDTPQITITHTGAIIGAEAVIQQLQAQGLGNPQTTRRCGQTTSRQPRKIGGSRSQVAPLVPVEDY